MNLRHPIPIISPPSHIRNGLIAQSASRTLYDAADQLDLDKWVGQFENQDLYDPAGNCVRRTDLSTGEITTYTYDAINRRLAAEDSSGVTTYTYDTNGNQLTVEEPNGDVTTNTWDDENQLVQVEHPTGDITTNTYNGDGRRVATDDGIDVTFFVYDGTNLLRETDDLGAAEAQFTYTPQPYGHIISQNRDGDSSFYHFDAINNVRALTDVSGVQTDEYLYDAWGKAFSMTGTTPSPYTYKGEAGYYHDPNLGPHESTFYLSNRVYSGQERRFKSTDPAEDDPNEYRYVRNNPVSNVDPSGLEPIELVHRTLPEYAPKIATEGLRAGKDGLIWMATGEAGTGASAEATVTMRYSLNVAEARSIPSEVIREAQQHANRSVPGKGLSSQEWGRQWARAKWNEVARWIHTQPEGVFKTSNPTPGQPGFHYAFKPEAFNSAKPLLTGFKGAGAEGAIAALAKSTAVAESEAAAAAAKARWGARVKFVGRVGGRVLVVVGIGASVYQIYTAENRVRQVVVEIGGWSGAFAGAVGGGKVGAATGGAVGVWFAGAGAAPGAAIGGFFGAIGGGIGGFFAGKAITETVYDWFFAPGVDAVASIRVDTIPAPENAIQAKGTAEEAPTRPMDEMETIRQRNQEIQRSPVGGGTIYDSYSGRPRLRR